jgi:hypothetical protein
VLRDILRKLAAGSKNMSEPVTHQTYMDALIEDAVREVDASVKRLREEVSGRTQVVNKKIAIATERLKNVGSGRK